MYLTPERVRALLEAVGDCEPDCSCRGKWRPEMTTEKENDDE